MKNNEYCILKVYFIWLLPSNFKDYYEMFWFKIIQLKLYKCNHVTMIDNYNFNKWFPYNEYCNSHLWHLYNIFYVKAILCKLILIYWKICKIMLLLMKIGVKSKYIIIIHGNLFEHGQLFHYAKNWQQ